MIFPFLFTGGLAIAYFLFPVVKQATKKLEEFKPIMADMFDGKMNKSEKSSLKVNDLIFHAEKDQIEILPNQAIQMPSKTINDNDSSEDIVIM